ncbi:hypothetical protein SARC_07426, partial [Sphaeroforma arctica JP610]
KARDDNEREAEKQKRELARAEAAARKKELAANKKKASKGANAEVGVMDGLLASLRTGEAFERPPDSSRRGRREKDNEGMDGVKGRLAKLQAPIAT